MSVLAEASLSADERLLLERFVDELERRVADDLDAVWLFGSRARGERPTPDSDVDLLVLIRDASWEEKMRVRETLDAVARGLDLQPVGWRFSIHVGTPAWLEQRRSIESFFIAEVDRDKIALSGRE
jgi:predicted nucleotidyltransferase